MLCFNYARYSRPRFTTAVVRRRHRYTGKPTTDGGRATPLGDGDGGDGGEEKNVDGETAPTTSVRSPIRRDSVTSASYPGARHSPTRAGTGRAAGGNGHITAEDILQRAIASYPALNLATVYRTLDVFVAKGLVTRADHGGNAAIFELVGEAVHHHLICERCGTVMAVDDTLLHQTRMTILRLPASP